MTITGPVPGNAPKALGGLAAIPLALIKPNPANVRRTGLGDLDELTDSIRADGILQPLIVEEMAGDYLVIAGHRRLAAAKRLGLTHIPCIVRKTAEGATHTARMLVENVQRADLHPLDEAHAYEALTKAGWSRGQIAAATGVRLHRIAARLDLLHLPAAAQTMVRAGELPLTQAAALARQVKTTRAGAVDVRPERCRPHFVEGHPLGQDARTRCDLAGHSTNGRVGGVACGACWEAAIRESAARHHPVTPDPPPTT